MAKKAKKDAQKAQAIGQKKKTRSRATLLTPEPTPGVDVERIAADHTRKVAETDTNAPVEEESKDPKQQLERVLGCADDAHSEILDIEPDASEDDILSAWRQLGCLLHPTYCQLEKAKDAFNKLQQAAEKKDVGQQYIDEVFLWDGDKDLEADGDQSSGENDEDDITMEEDIVPMPPSRVMTVYKEATPLLHRLAEDPANLELLGHLDGLNNTIRDWNKAENDQKTDQEEHISTDQWLIPVGFFGPQYTAILQDYNAIQNDSNNLVARHRLSVGKNLINELVKKHHFPEEWKVLSADNYLKQNVNEVAAVSTQEAAGKTAQEAAQKTTGADVIRIQYPWPTAEAADGSLIVGIRKQGRWGTQACIETVQEDGRVIRKLESASAIGLLEIEKYKATEGHKVLSANQSDWSSNDRHDFVELLWVTKTQILLKNVAAGNKDPPGECCARFRIKGINTLTVSSLSKVLGVTSARAQIDKVCQRDSILPPWKARWVSQYCDSAKVEKDPVRRRALQDAQASTSSGNPVQRRRRTSVHSSGSEVENAQEARVKALEATVKNLNDTVAGLSKTFQDFMKAFAARPSTS